MSALLPENHDPRVAVYEGCEKEPIHIPGSIQPHGALLAVDPESGEVLQASLNTTQYLGYEADALSGKSVSSLIGETASRQLQAANLKPAYPNLHEPVLVTVQGEDNRSRESIMLAHRHDDVLVLEFEPYEEGMVATIAAYHRLLAALSRISQSGSETELLQQAVREIQSLTGYDRVMYYRFEEDGTGIVTHESRAMAAICDPISIIISRPPISPCRRASCIVKTRCGSFSIPRRSRFPSGPRSTRVPAGRWIFPVPCSAASRRCT
ncbi:MAG: hypothetical protein U5P41_03180 [Gammaproteobacteria bacterium]|nr:hypothetical protein [Gammaproteobacteria bacterium]